MRNTIQAVHYNEYRGVDGMQLGAYDMTFDDSALLVRVETAALNPKDLLVAKGKFKWISGWRFPKYPGHDSAGIVERAAYGLKEGDRVFGTLNQWHQLRGTLADQVAVTANEVAKIPDGVPFSDAAAVSLVGLTALQALRNIGRVQPGASVLIDGASGGLGTVAIQIARILGARVTTVSSSATTSLCANLGAHDAMSYVELPGLLRSQQFDILFDVFGNLTFNDARGALRTSGVYVGTIPTAGIVFRNFLTRWSKQQERLVVVQSRRFDLEQLSQWLEEGSLRAVIAGQYPLNHFREALTQLATKHTHGKLIINVAKGRFAAIGSL